MLYEVITDWRGDTLQVFAEKLGVTPGPMNLHGDASMATARQLAERGRLDTLVPERVWQELVRNNFV